MARVLSLHSYVLKPATDIKDLERAFQQAKKAGLFDLPGLEGAQLLRGIKGEGRHQAAALWVYRDRQSWEQLWGAPEQPIGPQDYPEKWLRWERDLLGPCIEGDPDKVAFTSYQVQATFAAVGGRELP